MRNGIGLVMFLVGCSSSGSGRALPSATFTPHLDTVAADVACGEDTSFNGNPDPDLRYAFAYDGGGHLLHADGVWANNGPTDTIDYAWNGDNFTHMLYVSGWDGSQSEITASYDAANQLLDYTWAATGPSYNDSWSYAFSNFVGANQPSRETIAQAGQAVAAYQLVYDADHRLIQAIPDSGPTTSWTYDDAARTVDIDTGSGAFHGVIAYDDQDRPLSETWGGTDPSMIDSDETYDWSGDHLTSITYRAGSEQAPHTLATLEVDTMRYACASARSAAGHAKRIVRPRALR